jgi:hypothetical protein
MELCCVILGLLNCLLNIITKVELLASRIIF